MESQGKECADISYLVQNIPTTEITSTLQLLQKKTNPDLHNKILNINSSINRLNNVKSQMSDYDLMYLYHGVRSLSDVLQNLERKILVKLKTIEREYICNICMKRIRIKCGMTLLGNLNSHICKPCQRSASGDSTKDPIYQLKDYDLCQTIHYDHAIKEQLFFNTITTDGEKVYFYTILIIDEVLKCLVCECYFHTNSNIIQHAFGQRHAQELDRQYEYVYAFHRNFAKLELKYQPFQREFCILNNYKTKCLRCKKKIFFGDLLSHLKDGKCYNIKSDVTEVNYDDLIKKTIYRGLLDWHIVIANKQCPILQNIESKVYCIVCNTYVTKQISAHVNSDQHVGAVASEMTLQTIIKYHQIWCAQPVSIQIEQVYFRRRTEKITCTLCSTYMPYNAKTLTSHVESADHKKFMMRHKNIDTQSESGTSRSASVEPNKPSSKFSSESASSRSTSVEAEGHTASISSSSSNSAYKTRIHSNTNNDSTSPLKENSPVRNNILGKVKMVSYDKSIFDDLYPDGLIHFTLSIGRTKYPTIIKRGIYKYCFVCNTDVAISALLHANSLEHEELLQSEQRRALIKKFHDLWLDMPYEDQYRQVFFNIDDKLTCVLCDKGINYDTEELKSHLESWQHVQKVLSTYYNNVSIDKQDSNDLRESFDDESPLINLSPAENQTESFDGIIRENETVNPLPELCQQDPVLSETTFEKDSYNLNENLVDDSSLIILSPSDSNNLKENVTDDSPLIILSPTGDQTESSHEIIVDKTAISALPELYKQKDLSAERLINRGNQTESSDGIIRDDKMINILTDLYKRDPKCAQGLIKKELFSYFVEKATAENKNTQEKQIRCSPTKLETIPYSKEIINDLYGEELIHYNVRNNNVRYPFIQNMGSYKRCLICKIDLIGSVIFHINSTPHIDSCNNSEETDKLKRYHDLWLRFPESNQREQRYFEIGKKLTCAPCQKELDYDVDTLTSHIFSFGHAIKIWSLNNPSTEASGLTEEGDIPTEEIKVSEKQDLLELFDNHNEPETNLHGVDNSSSDDDLINFNSTTNDDNITQHNTVNLDQDLLIDLNQDITTKDLGNSPTTSTKKNRKFRSSGGIKNMNNSISSSENQTESNTSMMCSEVTNCVKYYTQNEQFAEEANFVKYNIYSTINFNSTTNDDNIIQHNTGNLDQDLLIDLNQDITTKDLGNSPTTAKKKNRKFRSRGIRNKNNSLSSSENQTESNTGMQYSEETNCVKYYAQNEQFAEEANFVKYKIYSTMRSDYKGNPSDETEITHNLLSRGLEIKSKSKLEALNDENVGLDWTNDHYFSQASNCVKYYIYSTMPTVEIIKGSAEASTKSCIPRLESYIKSLMKVKDSDPPKNAADPLGPIFIRNDIYYCVYCRDKCKKENHANAIHTKNIKKPKDYVIKYIQQLSKFGLPYAHKGNDFIPSTLFLTFCLKCGVHVEYSKLENHINQFHQDEHSLKEKLREDFPHVKGLYSESVLQTIFRHSPPECDVILNDVCYPILQISGHSVYCLLCFTEVIQDDPSDHLASSDHIDFHCSISKKRAMKRYHSGWSNVGAQYWNQIQFFNNESNVFHCILCNDKFGKRKLKQHFHTGKHLNQLIIQNFIGNVSSENLTNDNGNSESQYRSLMFNITDDMYLKKINEMVRKNNCLDVDIIQVSPNLRFMCLICQVEMEDVVKHTTTDLHHQTKLIDTFTNIKTIRFFHKSWSCMDAEFQLLQNLFYPVTPTVIFCTMCCINLNYTYLETHLRQCHTGSNVAFHEKLSPSFVFHSQQEYCKKVQIILYKDNVPQCNIIIDSIAYPVIQTLYSTTRCLLCHKEILEHPQDHLSSPDHAENVLHGHMKRGLKSYHDTWLGGDEDFQLQQMYFERDGQSFYCKLCLLNTNTSHLREHIGSDLHKASLNKFLIKKRVSGKINVFQDIEIIPQLSNDKVKLDSSVCSDELFNLDSESEDNETLHRHYDETVLEELYPHFNNHYLILDNIRYPLFRKTVVGFKCMICKRNPEVTWIDQHLMSDGHKTRLANSRNLNKFKSFHENWMKQEAFVQMHQKYFHRMRCIPCDVNISDYEAIRAHVQSSEHKEMISLPFIRNEDEEYDNSAFKSAAYDPTQHVSFKTVKSNIGGSPIKEVTKTKANPESPSKAGTSKKSGHDIRKSVAKPNSPSILDKIPLRYAAHKQFLITDKSNNIFCKCCSKRLNHDIRTIKEHLHSTHHITTSRIKKNKVKYYCEICVKHYSMESSWDNHLIDLTHIARYNNLVKTRRDSMMEYDCLTCKFVIYGDNISLKKHMSGLMAKKTKEITLPKPVLELLSSRDLIVQNAETLLLEANKASQSQDKERQVCMALVSVIREIYPMCKAYPFGSRVTGLGYSDSDLDVFLDIGDMYFGNQKQSAVEQSNIVNRVAKILQKHKTSFGDFNKVAAARTPIVQVFHKDSNVDCDISFKHGLSVENTAFISLCLDLQPILRPTILYLKEWYAATHLIGLSSYALTMLIVFYLQRNGFLLSITRLRNLNPEPSNKIDGWETIKYSVSLQTMRESVEICKYTVIQLMENFFDYYAKFDFEKLVICPLIGDLVAKDLFNGNGTNLPVEMARYVLKLSYLNPEYFRNLTPMCVQDPFDLSHNLTKACGKDMVKKFQAYCELSKKYISALN